MSKRTERDAQLTNDLVASAERGDTPACLRLLAQGADIDAADGNGDRPLLVAALRRQVPTAFALIECGANIQTRKKSGDSILHDAAEWPITDFTRLIALGTDVNALNATNTSPLHCVNDTDRAIALLRAGADPNARVKSGQTPLSNSLWIRNWELTELLVGFGASPDEAGPYGRSLLAIEQFRSSWEGASLLVALGAQSKPYLGRNRLWRRLFSLPRLHAAAAGGHTALALKLVDAGEDPARIFLRKTASGFALENRHFETAGALQACEARAAIDLIVHLTAKKKR